MIFIDAPRNAVDDLHSASPRYRKGSSQDRQLAYFFHPLTGGRQIRPVGRSSDGEVVEVRGHVPAGLGHTVAAELLR
ncbi:hypothetical protein ABZ322_40095, partial [Streptomyces sp. NPDC006129]|uniref:hypothetical protein n=1 Tax=Streptomyces sp. NPDC006129 TaxID=3155348 RepID=UPI0033A8E822